MIYFTLLLHKIIPLYANILMGYLAGKLLNANRDTIARVLFYMIAPLIIFNGVINTRLDPSIIMLPFLTFALSSTLCIAFYKLSKKLWNDSSKNLIAFSAGAGNTGYFGLPIALLLFDNQGEGIYIMGLLGITLYESSVGFYVFAKGTHTARECLLKIAKLPSLYAFIGGLMINLSGLKAPFLFAEFIGNIKGAYALLGMMIIGLGLSTIDKFRIDFKLIGMTFLAKFVAWPLLVIGVISIDTHLFGFFNQATYNALMLLSIVPLAANTVVLASLLKSQPEKAATAVLLSTVFALVYVPFMATYFIQSDATQVPLTVQVEEVVHPA